MLFILTGDRQVGKTRWLQALVARMEQRGVVVSGVLAPGVWREDPAKLAGREKLGIDNELLPQHAVVPFARRADLARVAGDVDAQSQSVRAGLGWICPDEALDEVNAHFSGLAAGAAGENAVGEAAPHQGFLVIDELGPLELVRGGGLTEAVRLLEAGPCERWPHALVVVRPELLEQAHGRFDGVWKDVREITPENYSEKEIISLYE